MDRNNTKLKISPVFGNIKYLAFAVIATALLYSLLPVSYTLFHRKIYNLIQSKKLDPVKIDTIKIDEKKEEVKQTKKIVKTKLSTPQSKSLARFNLDLSVLSGAEGGGIVSNTEFSNVIEEGEADVPPIKKIFIPPHYPSRAREEGVTGKVTAKLLIDENGDVISVRILKEPLHWGFGNAVIEAAQKWKFEPAKLNDLPVKVWATQVIEFTL